MPAARAPGRAPTGAPVECRRAGAATAAASPAAVLEGGLPTAGRAPDAGAGAAAGGDVVPAAEVVLNLALEEVRRSGEMGGMPYRSLAQSHHRGSWAAQVQCCNAGAGMDG